MSVVDTEPEQDRDRNRAVTRERRKAEQARELSDLLATRPELAEACPLAELAVQAVRWTA